MTTTYTPSPNVRASDQSYGAKPQIPFTVPMVMMTVVSKPNDFTLSSAPTIGSVKFG